MAISLTEEQVGAVRERILRTTERQIATRGIDGTSLRSIATEMGWTAASLYRYFASKGELLAAARAAHSRFSDRIEAAYASADDPWQRSRAIGDAYVAFAFTEPAAYQLIFAYNQPDSERTDDLRRAEAFADDDDRLCARHGDRRTAGRRSRRDRAVLLGGAARADRASHGEQAGRRAGLRTDAARSGAPHHARRPPLYPGSRTGSPSARATTSSTRDSSAGTCPSSISMASPWTRLHAQIERTSAARLSGAAPAACAALARRNAIASVPSI
jgi:AcrR family transcriptional regulator